MKARLLTISVFLISLIFTPIVYSQSITTIGVQGGLNYGNKDIGLKVGIEVPVKHHFEIDLKDEFSPYETHPPFGSGASNLIQLGSIMWLNKHVGLAARIQESSYRVKIYKTAYHVLPGIVFRTKWGGSPTRVEFNYVRQINNQFVDGIESSYLQAGKIAVTTRMGCSGKFCYRLGWEFGGGRVLTQSNPYCDGTLPGVITCRRNSLVSGGFKVSFELEFPRRPETENEAF